MSKQYYIGDPCYFIRDEQWNAFLDDAFWPNEQAGRFEFEWDGRRIFCHSTAYGDGCYRGTDGNDYPVDAGLIAVVEMLPGENLDRDDLGTVREFDSFPSCHYDDGTFVIGDFEIYTDADPEDEDEEY